MTLLGLVLNLPWTLLGVLGALLSRPTGVTLSTSPPAIIVRVKSLWWLGWLPSYRGVRAATLGNLILEGPHLLPRDSQHELIHVEQAMRRPLIHPILYAAQSLRHGYRNNPYEQEAYRRARNTYVEN